MSGTISDDLKSGALFYHRNPRPGKLEIQPTKPLGNQRDLALAYSPGVAAACEAIAAEPDEAATLTSRQNLVAVVSNGTAVLGLGDIGPLAAKPVMEGKAVLFKKFAGIDVFDIEVAEKNVTKLVDVVAALEPTFGGINLEDIKAPECFEVEEQCRARMNIPVFHDDQHGTAIIVAAAVLNGLELAGKQLSDARIVTSGAGAAALACLNLLVSLGARRQNITVTDIEGVVYAGRETLMDRWKAVYAQNTQARTLADVIPGADIFLGLSAGGVLKPEYLDSMAEKPLILALANPYPEIMPNLAEERRPDAMICTGRSDFPNQVNNVLCFPYIFRGALDVGATTINEEMKAAAVKAIAGLARETPSDVVARAYGGEARPFGPHSLIPSPFDPRLILRIAPAVARAAMESGVAKRPLPDIQAYAESLDRFVHRSGFIMKPVFTQAKQDPRRVVYAEGEDERVLRAVQAIVEEGLAKPILVGRPNVVEVRLKRFGLSIRRGTDFELINPDDDPRYRSYVQTYMEAAGRRGVTPDAARTLVRTNAAVIGALMVRRGEADALICGLEGRFESKLRVIRDIIGLAPGYKDLAALSLIVTAQGAYFLADTHVRPDPSVAEIADVAIACGDTVRRFGLTPKIALVSHADFGSFDTPSARKMRDALALIRERAPELEVDGEMGADTALSQMVRDRVLPNSRLKGEANVLIMPNLDAANIAFQMSKMLANALPVGPLLIGPAKPAHILTPSVTARGIVNITAAAVVEAQARCGAVPAAETTAEAGTPLTSE
ncbi:Malate dehydrogenase (oxaloacetate-decarboxylating) (NADP(+)), Phosphate acetyltransferase [Methylobacterium sp. 4-46]|uniref:NADP-dependent malic enzyme n=1 Tax=unclassified Methylobacterium TaxID=2615210 RepID=UPI000165C8AA|nr:MULTISPECIES: NADP-dependent malic enzyme [Methylobacterium]ACA16924.1 Malate dehydrogenase (oxaloacetate-decarboxylating) (NADP(+)), Phosphate acetyltransferase [Methylobacterium sp. 4-46]WFT82611.1 NADP-dependent malic enzyme [Methylobacterium nodulans]